MRALRIVALAAATSPVAALAGEPATSADVTTSAAVTGYYYAMRDQPDFGVGVATLDHGRLHFEARYNYEVQQRGLCVRRLEIRWRRRCVVRSDADRRRAVRRGARRDSRRRGQCRVGPVRRVCRSRVRRRPFAGRRQLLLRLERAWLDAGRVAARGPRWPAHAVPSTPDRDLQRGAFAQVTVQRLTFGIYAFNPDSAARYIIASVGVQF